MTQRNIAKRNRTAAKARTTRRTIGQAIEQLEGRTLYSTVPFNLATGNLVQDWSNAGLITAANDWSSVPSIVGYKGDDGNASSPTGVDPSTVVTPYDALPNVQFDQTNPNTNTAGGLAEFAITNPVVAMQGSQTADFPSLTLYLDTTGRDAVTVSYNLRDIDGSTDNSIQPIALQYRIGNSGNFTNVSVVADASTGPSLATLVTPVSVVLPDAAEGQANLQVRIMTNNAVGNDEWIGVDDINVSSVAQAAQTIGFSATTASVTETLGGTNATLTVTRSNGTGVASIDYATGVAGSGIFSATAGTDYTTSSGTLTFTAGQTSKTITVPILDDAVAEVDQVFAVNLTNAQVVSGIPQGVSISTNPITVTIVDDDAITGPKALAAGPLTQDWTNINQIVQDNDWSGVPYIRGYSGVGLSPTNDTDPQTVLADSTVLDVAANQTASYLTLAGQDASGTGGVVELELANPTVALNGANTEQAPNLVFSVDTTSVNSVDVAYKVRDLDPTTDNAITQVALQYRVGNTGNFTNIPAGYISDATTGGTDTQVTNVAVTLTDPNIINKPLVQFRVITTNATGNDEFIGIDDIVIQKTPALAGTASFPLSGRLVNVDEAAGTAQLLVTRTGGSTGTLTVNYATSLIADATGASSADFTATSGTLTFVNGDLEEFINIPITNDTIVEKDENFLVTLSGAGAGGTPVATVRIVSDDLYKLSTGNFTQDWTTDPFTVDDYWGNVIGIKGYRGDGLTGSTGVDPQIVLKFAATTPIANPTPNPLDININQTLPDEFFSGGVAEFEGDSFSIMGNRTVALTGSGTAAAPFLLFTLDSTGMQNVNVSYKLRDLEVSPDNAVQQFALQYRVGGTGDFINVPAGYVADATMGANDADPILVTSVTATLPAGANNQANLQIRVITTNAAGNDEWVGVDDIVVSAVAIPPSTLPDWLDQSSVATYDSANNILTVTGSATIIADPANYPTAHPTINVTTGTLNINGPANARVNLGVLNISATGTATVLATGAIRTLVVEGAFTIANGGKLDLTDNAMVAKNSALSDIKSLIVTGFNGGDFGGKGLTSTTAKTDPNGLTAIGYISNGELGATSFEGASGLDNNDILIKYTYYGDTDLNGMVDADDFNQFLAGYQDSSLPRTWLYGDFDYNGLIDADDFNQFLASYQFNGPKL